jgi:hypothetical protein
VASRGVVSALSPQPAAAEQAARGVAEVPGPSEPQRQTNNARKQALSGCTVRVFVCLRFRSFLRFGPGTVEGYLIYSIRAAPGLRLCLFVPHRVAAARLGVFASLAGFSRGWWYLSPTACCAVVRYSEYSHRAASARHPRTQRPSVGRSACVSAANPDFEGSRACEGTRSTRVCVCISMPTHVYLCLYIFI